MKKFTKSTGKDGDEYEDQFLHQTIGGSKIKSNSSKHGSHKLNRHYTSSALTPPTATSSSSSSITSGQNAAAVSAYLENLPSVSTATAPPRPARPPGGLLGISNGKGMGYGRTLGASYDSPMTAHGSFNGHVRSGANLYGGTSQSTGSSPIMAEPTSGGYSHHHQRHHHHRPTLSVFPIQKAMEISMKEWKLLNAASNRAEPISTGRGPNSGMTFVTELKRLRHARGALFADHTGSKDELIAQSYGGDGDQTAVDTIKTDTGYDDGLARNVGISLEEMDISKAYSAHTRPVHEHGDIRIQRPAITSYDAKMHYPGIAHLHHSLTSQTGAVAIRHSSPSKNVYPSGSAVHKVRELLDSYPAPSPYCVDEKKRSPLHFAAASGDLELVEFLLDRGVRPDCGRDIAGNMPLHLAIISNRIDVVAALLRAGADMTLASPMTLKTPLDLAESRLSYLLSRAQGASKTPQPEAIGLFGNSQVATRSAMLMSSQSPALLEQIKGIVGLLRPYVVRQQRLQNGDRQRERQNGRSWELADKYMRQQANEVSSSSESMWRTDIHSDDNYGDMEDVGEDDEDDSMMGIDSKHPRRGTNLDLDDSLEMHEDLPSYNGRPARKNRRLPRRMNANETEEALESLMNGLSLLEASRIQQHQQQVAASGTGIHQQNSQRLNTSIVSLEHGGSDIGDGNLADSELDPRNDSEVEEALPDLLEQVQQVLQSIKLNETKNQL